jgi:hypothetical protein
LSGSHAILLGIRGYFAVGFLISYPELCDV